MFITYCLWIYLLFDKLVTEATADGNNGRRRGGQPGKETIYSSGRTTLYCKSAFNYWGICAITCFSTGPTNF
jgi:hypothetical protein